MNGQWLSTAAVVGVLGALCAGCGGGQSEVQARAQALQQAGTAATAMGCPQQNVEKACLTLKGAGGVVYDISAAGVDMTRGRGVSLAGRDRGETSACGKVLSDVSYDYLGIQCAAPQTVADAGTAPAADAAPAR